jgi:hypothetical protein
MGESYVQKPHGIRAQRAGCVRAGGPAVHGGRHSTGGHLHGIAGVLAGWVSVVALFHTHTRTPRCPWRRSTLLPAACASHPFTCSVRWGPCTLSIMPTCCSTMWWEGQRSRCGSEANRLPAAPPPPLHSRSHRCRPPCAWGTVVRLCDPVCALTRMFGAQRACFPDCALTGVLAQLAPALVSCSCVCLCAWPGNAATPRTVTCDGPVAFPALAAAGWCTTRAAVHVDGEGVDSSHTPLSLWAPPRQFYGNLISARVPGCRVPCACACVCACVCVRAVCVTCAMCITCAMCARRGCWGRA